MLPVRCYTCNKVLGDKGAVFKCLRESEKDLMITWKKLGITRDCCRVILLSHVDFTESTMDYCDYNPCKYIEIRKHAPMEKVITINDDDEGGGGKANECYIEGGGGKEDNSKPEFYNKPRIYKAV